MFSDKYSLIGKVLNCDFNYMGSNPFIYHYLLKTMNYKINITKLKSLNNSNILNNIFSKDSSFIYKFTNELKEFFYRKNIFITYCNINDHLNSLYVSINFYFKKKSLIKIKKKIQFLKNNKNKTIPSIFLNFIKSKIFKKSKIIITLQKKIIKKKKLFKKVKNKRLYSFSFKNYKKKIALKKKILLKKEIKINFFKKYYIKKINRNLTSYLFLKNKFKIVKKFFKYLILDKIIAKKFILKILLKKKLSLILTLNLIRLLNINNLIEKKRYINIIKLFVKKLKKKNSIVFFRKKSFIIKFFKLFSKSFNYNLLYLKFNFLNKFIFKKPFRILKKKFQRFEKMLFNRRKSFFIDFIKLILLYESNKINLHSLIEVLADIFRRLTKRLHAKFFNFIKDFFKFFIFKLKKKKKFFKFKKNLTQIPLKKLVQKNLIKGIKFIIKGKLKGKLRARTRKIRIGSTPISTFNKNVEFSKIDSYTVYGTFGLKLWIYKK